ncbi:MAG: OmpA family protein [Ignavibacteriae bacterium]|nr:chemotaxis protein MotB [Ignavibacteriota bacterium]NOG97172.1 OmpA family protein [Ignavibacteriota bacterium]
MNENVDFEESPFTDSSDKDRYLITYADLITLLLGLFIILYAISNVDIEKYKSMISVMGNVFGNSGEVIGLEKKSSIINVEEIDQLKFKVNQLIQEYDYENAVKVEENERGIIIRILEEILFASGSAELGNNSKQVLKQIGAIIQSLPNDIRIEGHTDDIPISTAQYPSNWHLSVTRALNTAYYLINDENINPEKVSIVGYSEYKPVQPNEEIKNRALNRRVDIVIIKE